MIDPIDSRVGPLSRHAVVQGYRRYWKLLCDSDTSPTFDPDNVDEAGYDAFVNTIRSGPALQAWELVLELLRTVPDDDLGFWAAGPLEDLVQSRGAELVEEIEAEASRDARFQWALGCIWLSHGELSAEVLARVVRASGDAIRPLPSHAELEAKWPDFADDPNASDDIGPEAR